MQGRGRRQLRRAAAMFEMPELTNVLLLAGEALIYFVALGALLRARKRIGLGAFFCALGVMHFLETYLASILYVPLPFGIVASPGSTVLFTGKLMMLLLLYIREDAVVVRQPIYGLLFGNVLLFALGFVHAPPHRAVDGHVRRFRLPRPHGRVDGVGNGDPVLRLHHHHPAVRAHARLVRRPPVAAPGALPARWC